MGWPNKLPVSASTALDGAVISDAEWSSLTWLAGFEARTWRKSPSVIIRARQTR
jgi:hypothetical protein